MTHNPRTEFWRLKNREKRTRFDYDRQVKLLELLEANGAPLIGNIGGTAHRKILTDHIKPEAEGSCSSVEAISVFASQLKRGVINVALSIKHP